MAWKRKRTFRTRRVFKRRFARKSFSRRPTKKYSSGVYKFKRTWTTASGISAGQAAPYLGTFSFQLSDLPTFTDFTGLYQQYKITGVKMKFFQPYQNGAAVMVNQLGGTSLTQPMIRMHSVFDPNDNATTGIPALQQYQTYKIQELTSPSIGKDGCLKFFYRPKEAVATANTGLSLTGYGAPGKGMWLDTDYPNVPYYGFKWAFDPVYADGSGVQFTSPVTVPIALTYYIKCKGVK